jgi:hypothetical protein
MDLFVLCTLALRFAFLREIEDSVLYVLVVWCVRLSFF